MYASVAKDEVTAYIHLVGNVYRSFLVSKLSPSEMTNRLKKTEEAFKSAETKEGDTAKEDSLKHLAQKVLEAGPTPPHEHIWALYAGKP